MANLVQGNNGSAVQYIVTGVVLLLAAAVDALSRRRAGASGLA
jgi:D-xylose transport system permease protein